MISILGDIPESPERESYFRGAQYQENTTDWTLRPGLLWYQAPWIAIDLVSKNPCNVDWDAKPPFASCYNNEGQLNEDIFPKRWSNSSTTHPEQKAQRAKRRSRAARNRAKAAAETFKQEELEIRLKWSLLELRPKTSASPQEFARLSIERQLSYDSFAAESVSGSEDSSSQTPLDRDDLSGWNISSVRDLQLDGSDTPQDVNLMATIIPQNRRIEQLEAQRHSVPTWSTLPQPFFDNTATQTNRTYQENAMASATTENRLTMSVGHLDMLSPEVEYDQRNIHSSLGPVEPTPAPSGPSAQEYFYPWNFDFTI